MQMCLLQGPALHHAPDTCQLAGMVMEQPRSSCCGQHESIAHERSGMALHIAASAAVEHISQQVSR